MQRDDEPTVRSAEAFQRLVSDPTTPHAQLVGVKAPAAVWWDVLERYPHSAAWVAANTSPSPATLRPAAWFVPR